MNSKKLLIVLGLICISVLSINAQAGERCPAGESGCTVDNATERIRDRANEGARRIIKEESLNGRVIEVKDTVKECVQCGTDAVRDGLDKVGGGRGGSSE